ncbi:MAG: hypothetical protein NWQ07_07625 [Flaviramulus sp.]|nr:hypothetical protein [Flaviramulus sp.]
MKIKKRLVIFILGFLISCNSKNKSEEKQVEDKLLQSLVRKGVDNKDLKNTFLVILNVLANKNDNFQLFYTEDYMLSFNEDQSIIKLISGANDYQNIVFTLPSNVLPDRLRIDVGSNRNQKVIKIKSLLFRYNDKEVFIPSELISKLLVPNEFVNYRLGEDTYNLLTLNVEDKTIYDPAFTCSPELVRLLLAIK